jgi:hypothetical protein
MYRDMSKALTGAGKKSKSDTEPEKKDTKKESRLDDLRALLIEDDLSRAGLKMTTADGTVTLTGKTNRMKDYLQTQGFKFNPATKAWFRVQKGFDAQQFLAGLFP